MDPLDMLNRAIAEEQLKEFDPQITEAQIEKVWAMCKGNPWDAAPLYQIIRLAGELKMPMSEKAQDVLRPETKDATPT